MRTWWVRSTKTQKQVVHTWTIKHVYMFGNLGKKNNVYTRITSLSSRVIFPFSHSFWNIPDEKNKDCSYAINPKHNAQEYFFTYTCSYIYIYIRPLYVYVHIHTAVLIRLRTPWRICKYVMNKLFYITDVYIFSCVSFPGWLWSMMIHVIVVHESLVGPKQFYCLLFFRRSLQLLHILWFYNLFYIFQPFPTVIVWFWDPSFIWRTIDLP